MSPREIAWRFQEQALRKAWSRRQVRPGQLDALPTLPASPGRERRFTSVLPPDAAAGVPAAARAAILADADAIMGGAWEMLGITRDDMKEPDWFRDPDTGRRSDPSAYAFSINHRSQDAVGNIKQVWEVNRLQHLTLLAMAWYLTRDDAYAARADAQLRAWWGENPFLSGVNWASGIELGVRLMNFAWIRRLLDEWPGARDLFEDNDLALHQIRWHQQYLAAFESRGSSANNHLIAEAAGLLAASCAFPWFDESPRWRRHALGVLERSLRDNTFPSGINRELATDYHGFVFELGTFAAAEALAAGAPVSDDCWQLLCSMADCMAALVDSQLRPPRQADSDEGRVVLLDAPQHNRWPALLSLASGLFGALDWWPEVPADAGRVLLAALAGGGAAGGVSAVEAAAGGVRAVAGRASQRPNRFADAGITLLRTSPDAGSEIWCRCDGGPHGFLSIAAHAHADALSIEVRHAGVDILADPGTYCYHGEPAWRTYFRSTVGHNTIEIGGSDQSTQSGAFMWARQARTRELAVRDPERDWSAEHDGYRDLRPPVKHRRSVRLDPDARALEITDVLDATGQDLRVAFHLGPAVDAVLEAGVATLSWHDSPIRGEARLELPAALEWSLHKGETAPIMGWYSAGLGMRVPAVTILGSGSCLPQSPLITQLKFIESRQSPDSSPPVRAVNWKRSGAPSYLASGITTEG